LALCLLDIYALLSPNSHIRWRCRQFEKIGPSLKDESQHIVKTSVYYIMKKSKKLTLEERIKIRTHLEHLVNPSQIARKLDRARSTITRELNKWGYKEDYFSFKDYDPSIAHFCSKDATGCVHRFECKLDKNPRLLKKVRDLLELRWSPQQVSARLKKNHPNDKSLHISHESIYKFIYFVANPELKKELISYLRRKKAKRKSSIGSRKHKSYHFIYSRYC